MTKEQEREELHRTIWQIANDLRGSVDGWDFKSYVLGFLFYRFISENLTSYINKEEQRTGNSKFDFTKISDKDAEFGRADTVKEKGFYILPSELFLNVCRKAKNDANLNETLSNVFKNIENSAKGTDSEDDLKGLFKDIDVNSDKLGATVTKRNEVLVKILESIGDLKLGDYKDNSIDTFGDAYEFLMSMYASNAGKSGGEFFTPQEVSELLAEITVVGKKQVNKVYDPACGSGSLLLKFAKVLGKENVRQGFYGQEKNITTYNLCRINMFLHDINYEKFDIAHGDTLTDPKHWDDEPFDCIVSNPPYSIKWDGDANPLLINDPRFSPAGVLAPQSKADLAFTMHMLSWLSTSGTAAIVEYPGVLSRVGAEQKIRKYLVDNNYVDTIIQLPANLFFGVSIATCIIVLKKSKRENKTLFIDASNEFEHVGIKNKLTKENRLKILNAFIQRQDIEYFSSIVDNSVVALNGYDLQVNKYVIQNNISEIFDIQQLNVQIEETVSKQSELRDIIDNFCLGDLTVFDSEEHEVKWHILNDIIDFMNGKGHEKHIVENGKYIVVNSKFVSTSGIVKKYSEKQISPIYKNDILMVMSDLPNGKALAKCFYVDEDDKYTLNQRICALSVKNNCEVDAKYLYYILNRNKQLLKYDNGSDQTNLRKDDILKINIPIPPLSVQQVIVNILDNFSQLEIELMKELEAHRKQFEFYKGKLLDF